MVQFVALFLALFLVALIASLIGFPFAPFAIWYRCRSPDPGGLIEFSAVHELEKNFLTKLAWQIYEGDSSR